MVSTKRQVMECHYGYVLFACRIFHTFVENCDRQTDRMTKLGTEAPSPDLKNIGELDLEFDIYLLK